MTEDEMLKEDEELLNELEDSKCAVKVAVSGSESGNAVRDLESEMRPLLSQPTAANIEIETLQRDVRRLQGEIDRVCARLDERERLAALLMRMTEEERKRLRLEPLSPIAKEGLESIFKARANVKSEAPKCPMCKDRQWMAAPHDRQSGVPVYRRIPCPSCSPGKDPARPNSSEAKPHDPAAFSAEAQELGHAVYEAVQAEMERCALLITGMATKMRYSDERHARDPAAVLDEAAAAIRHSSGR